MVSGRKSIRIICVTLGPELPRRLKTLDVLSGGTVVFEPDMDRVLERFEREAFDVLLLSSAAFKAERAAGLELIEVVAARSSITQVLFLADERDMESAMSALRAGSFQYAKLPVSDEELELLIQTALQQRPRDGRNSLIKRKGGQKRFQELMGGSTAMHAVYRQIEQAAATDMPVLIAGETGTGKDLAARAIHAHSPRSREEFLPVNLGALPREMVASELFGHEKGSFTGAVGSHQGIFERASRGTVFLDEIGCTDAKVQVSLLRLLEQKRFHRLGGRRWLRTEARVITASNEDLADAVRRGRFREDLFFRLDVFRISMPPLRERRGDIRLLAEEFVGRYRRQFRRSVRSVHPECLEVLEQHAWPGNVRELKNVIQRGVLMCMGAELECRHLPERLRAPAGGKESVTFDAGTPLRVVERKMIAATLRSTGNNRKRAAERLGISRRALYNKLRRYAID